LKRLLWNQISAYRKKSQAVGQPQFRVSTHVTFELPDWQIDTDIKVLNNKATSVRREAWLTYRRLHVPGRLLLLARLLCARGCC
jgi:hypothetical protein